MAHAPQPWHLIPVGGNCYNFCPGVLGNIGAFHVGVRINLSRELRNSEVVGGKTSTLHNTQWVTLASKQTQYDSYEHFYQAKEKKNHRGMTFSEVEILNQNTVSPGSMYLF